MKLYIFISIFWLHELSCLSWDPLNSRRFGRNIASTRYRLDAKKKVVDDLTNESPEAGMYSLWRVYSRDIYFIRLFNSAAKMEALNGVLHQIEKCYGKGSIQKLGSTSSMNVEMTPSGSITV